MEEAPESFARQEVNIQPPVKDENFSFWTNISKSFRYALINASIGLSVGIAIATILSSIILLTVGDQILLVKSSYDASWFLRPIAALIGGRALFVIVPIMIAIVIFSIWNFIVFLRLFNPNISRKYIRENGIGYWRLIGWAFLTSILVEILQQVVYHTLLPLGHYMTIFNTAAIIIGTACWWGLWHEDGIWGDLKHFSKYKESRAPLFNFHRQEFIIHWRRILAGSTLIAVWGYSLVIFATTIYSNLFLNIASSGVRPESPWMPMASFYWIIIVAFLGGSVGLPLVFAFANMKAGAKTVLSRLIVPLAITVAFIGNWHYANTIVTNFDFDKNFFTQTNINPTEEATRTIIDFSSSTPQITSRNSHVSIFVYQPTKIDLLNVQESQAAAQAIESSTVPDINCSEGNTQKVESLKPYLEAKNYESALAKPYFDYLAGLAFEGGCYGESWKLDQLAETRFLKFLTGGDPLAGALLANRIGTFAQVKPEYIDILNKLSDEATFHIGYSAAKNLGDALYHYGEYDKARQMYLKAQSLGYKDTLTSLNANGTAFLSGNISGHLSFNGLPAQNFSVGLEIDSRAVRTKEGKAWYGIYDPDLPDSKPIVASAQTDSSGNFSFPNLVVDQYYLAIMLPPETTLNPTAKIAIDKPFTQITIDADHPVWDLGSIAVSNQ